MKKLILSLVAIATISLSSFGQAPEGFKYQAVVRDAGNTILNNQAVGMRMTIQQGSIGGTTVYQETFVPTTNAYGLVNLEIGSGTVVSGDFTTIDWANGPYFIETAVDVTGGTSYAVMGTSQLMSVPYALHANTAENVTNDLVDDADADPTNELQDWSNLPGIPANIDTDATDDFSGDYNDLTNQPTIPTNVSAFTNDAGYLTTEVDSSITNELQTISRTGTTVTLSNGGGTFEDSVGVYTAGTGIDITNNVISTSGTVVCTYSIGDLVPELGGYIFFLDASGCHGLVAAPSDLSTGSAWYNGSYIVTGATFDGVKAGQSNTKLIIDTQGAGPYAASLCSTPIYSNYGLFEDWYLPSKYELNLMYLNIGQGNALGLGNVGGFANTNYWSSSEWDNFNARFQSFVNGNQLSNGKNVTYYVRAVRAF